MKNTIPKIHADLLTLAGVAANAANLYGSGIPLLHNTNLKINADIQPLVDAIMAHGSGRLEMKTCRETLESTIQDCRVSLMLGRDSLKPLFGNQFTQDWLPFGHDGSLEVSENVPQLFTLLRSYKEVLEGNPDYELPTKNFTAVHLATLFTQLETALNAVTVQDAVVGDLMEDRDAKAEKLRKRMRGLVEELNQTIDPLDQRWKAFGFNMPGAQETPDSVEHIQAVLIGPNAVALKWDPSARAEYYRVFTKIHGAEGDYTAVGSPADLDFTIENLPANATIDIIVTAVNNGGESAASEVVTITTN